MECTCMLFTIENGSSAHALVSGVASFHFISLIIHNYWWTASIKPRLLFSRACYASWGLPFHQLNITYYSWCLVPDTNIVSLIKVIKVACWAPAVIHIIILSLVLHIRWTDRRHQPPQQLSICVMCGIWPLQTVGKHKVIVIRFCLFGFNAQSNYPGVTTSFLLGYHCYRLAAFYLNQR